MHFLYNFIGELGWLMCPKPAVKNYLKKRQKYAEMIWNDPTYGNFQAKK